MNERRLSILFAGGGTGGHLYPALAVADEIRRLRENTIITFVGTKGRLESRVVPSRGYAFKTLWISGLTRTLSLATLLFPLKLFVASIQSVVLLFRVRPKVVVGTGGYVSGPPVFVGQVLGIPTILQEQNSYPGVTTRLLAARAREVHVTFEQTQRYLKRLDNVKVTGNPIRAVIGTVTRTDGAASLGINPSRRTLLVIGGSQGAVSLNSAILEILGELLAMDIQIVWGTGDADFDRVASAVRAVPPGHVADVFLHRYIDRMECAYAAADLALARAGATTLAELMRAGVPAVLVPYPFAAADHQTANAAAMVEAGAAVIWRDSETRSTLLREIQGLLQDRRRLDLMGSRAREIARPLAAGQLAAAVLRLAEK